MRDVFFTSIAGWKEYAESLLPAVPFVKKRNRKITCVYAELYHENPLLFKWAGMASFASHKVGMVLEPFRFYENEDGSVDSRLDFEACPLDLLDDVDVIRWTNNKVYEDIAWVHFAYTSSRGGISLVKELLKKEPDQNLLLEGFVNIEKGRLLMETDAADAMQKIWYGNTLLLKHEQFFTVQSFF